jgi:uncharacterized protein (DUF3820 family)
MSKESHSTLPHQNHKNARQALRKLSDAKFRLHSSKIHPIITPEHRLPFGKYQGFEIRKVDPAYLRWVASSFVKDTIYPGSYKDQFIQYIKSLPYDNT